MLIVIAKSKIKEGQIKPYLDAVRELAEKSRAEEGNDSFRVAQSADNPAVVAFVEVWKDQSAFDFHTKTEHFTTILPALSVYVEEQYPTEFYTDAVL